MIELTRLNGNSLVVNSDLIQYVESAPDTTLTLLNGEKVVVREGAGEVIDLTIAFRSRLLAEVSRFCPGGIVIAPAAPHALPPQASRDLQDEMEREAATAARKRRRQS
jgi:flagellar protein FlbD